MVSNQQHKPLINKAAQLLARAITRAEERKERAEVSLQRELSTFEIKSLKLHCSRLLSSEDPLDDARLGDLLKATFDLDSTACDLMGWRENRLAAERTLRVLAEQQQKFPHATLLSDHKQFPSAVAWCEENVGERHKRWRPLATNPNADVQPSTQHLYSRLNVMFCFRDAQDAVLFKLSRA